MTRLEATLQLPDWPAPAGVRAVTTTRRGGVSIGPYAEFNLADHVGDAPAHVAENRARLARLLDLPAAPRWLTQVHGNRVASGAALTGEPEADAAITRAPGEVLAILTADCLPVLLCRRGGGDLGAAHCGWRSLSGGIVENTVAALGGDPGELLAWLGPAIGPDAFEVGPEVREAFVAHDRAAAVAFRPSSRKGHFFADLFELGRQRLRAVGVHDIYGGGVCTVRGAANYFSYRRDGECGRMATLIWRTPCASPPSR